VVVEAFLFATITPNQVKRMPKILLIRQVKIIEYKNNDRERKKEKTI